jgi:hypothetical protein
VLGHHLVTVRVTLDGFGIAEPTAFAEQLQNAGRESRPIIRSSELSMAKIDDLRSRMLDAASLAREQHIGNQIGAYAEARAEVETVIEQLRELYKQDASPFDEKLLADIRTAKLCARIITYVDLDQEAVERERQSIVTAHKTFLRDRGLENRGTRLGLGHKRRHFAGCYICKRHLDNAIDVECVACGWIVCGCGACGCGYDTSSSRHLGAPA